MFVTKEDVQIPTEPHCPAEDLRIRPIVPADEAMMVEFHRSLSPESVYTRYFNVLKLNRRIDHARLDRVCHPESGHEFVVVAELSGNRGSRRIAGIGRLSIESETRTGEFALIVRDSDQHQGIGTQLLECLIREGRKLQLPRLVAHILSSNFSMQTLCARAGMQLRQSPSGQDIRAELELAAPQAHFIGDSVAEPAEVPPPMAAQI